MGRFRKKPVVIDATQWFKVGDHREVSENELPLGCPNCGRPDGDHGRIVTLESSGEGHFVCPGDWIITGVKGEFYPCKPDIFDQTYEPVVEEATDVE